MGMVVISSSLAVGPIAQTLSADGKPIGEGGGKALERRVSALRRRSRLVDGSGEGAAGEEAAALLKGHTPGTG